jgi:hypothetical protein
MPFLYRTIWLDLEDPQLRPVLLSSLESSSTKALLSPQEPDGYGVCTEMLTLSIPETGPYQRSISVGIRDLVDKLPGLRRLNIEPYITLDTSLELPSLKTLTLNRVDLSILFDHIPTLQALESLQRLSITSCDDRASSSRPSQQPLPRVYFPNLLEISFSRGYTLVDIKPFTTISTWTMPRLRSIHFRVDIAIDGSPLFDLFNLLRTHGPQLHSLTLTTYLQEQDISTLLTLCNGLRSLDIESSVSLCALFASHAHLEKIKVKSGLAVRSMNDLDMIIAVDALKSLKLRARVSFPKLSKAELNVLVFAGGSHRNSTVSFSTGDEFITFSDEGKIYRLFDGQAEFVGAYFGPGSRLF